MDPIRKLRRLRYLADHHVKAAATYEKLIYSGYASQSLRLEKVSTSIRAEPNLSGLLLAKLPSETSKVLRLFIIDHKSLIDLGYMYGAKSRRAAHRRGIAKLKHHLDVAYPILC